MSESPKPIFYDPDEFDEWPDFAEGEGPIDVGWGPPLETSAVGELEDDAGRHPNPSGEFDVDGYDDDHHFEMDHSDEDELHQVIQRTQNVDNESFSYQDGDSDAVRNPLLPPFEQPSAKRAKLASTLSPLATPKKLFLSGDSVTQLSQSNHKKVDDVSVATKDAAKEVVSKDKKESCHNCKNTDSLEENKDVGETEDDMALIEQSFMDQSLEESETPTKSKETTLVSSGKDHGGDNEVNGEDILAIDMLMEDLDYVHEENGQVGEAADGGTHGGDEELDGDDAMIDMLMEDLESTNALT